MRRGTWVCMSLGPLAFAACSGGGGGGPGAADTGGNVVGDVGVAPDRAGADENDVTDAGAPPEPADAAPDGRTDTSGPPEPADAVPDGRTDTGGAPDSADVRQSSRDDTGGDDTGVAPDLADARRNDGRDAGAPSDVVEAGRDGGRDVGAVPADLAPAGDTGAALPWPTGKYISVDEVYARVQANDADMLLVNVVDEEYYSYGFIAGSLKIPWDTLAGRLGELDPARHIVAYCRRGTRSESAYTTLKDNAFPLVWTMEGGIEAWIAAGYPVVPE
jgi:rhodanese-related sulfurtransferase